ncbi:U7 snRNA-associated Sm-like protein LSm10 [Trachymyrmex cornetzi]|uniref:U7 snRNA-associated Sm-like protein LSm10 n=1 Tax=Trachymyrmex cornetzi TaxID=471704 RepID=A0A151IVU8_9HYME|nr:U7 snRNA-associated Sm-like protein LSm10 [Trachymyrmex cornetzi]
MSNGSRREQYFLYNTLSILLKAVEKTRTTVDLRNEATIVGIIENTDAYMNIVMKDCVFTDPRGDSFKYDMFFVQARNIRSVHVPMNVSASKSFSPLTMTISVSRILSRLGESEAYK